MPRYSTDPILDYLGYCYLYYNKSESVISDHEFDELAREIERNWDKLQSPLKQFLLDAEGGSVEGLKGTEFRECQVPKNVKQHARSILQQHSDSMEAFSQG